jgi:hypothetical protein
VLHDDRNRLGLRQLTEDMHMVRNAAHNQCRALEILQNRRQISVCSLPQILVGKQRLSILGRED